MCGDGVMLAKIRCDVLDEAAALLRLLSEADDERE